MSIYMLMAAILVFPAGRTVPGGDAMTASFDPPIGPTLDTPRQSFSA